MVTVLAPNEVVCRVNDVVGEQLCLCREGYVRDGLLACRLEIDSERSVGTYEKADGGFLAVAVTEDGAPAEQRAFASFTDALRFVVDTLPRADETWSALQDRAQWITLLRVVGLNGLKVQWSGDCLFCRVNTETEWVTYQVYGPILEVTMEKVGRESKTRRTVCGSPEACIERGKRILGQAFRLDLLDLMEAPFRSKLFES